MTAPDIVQLDDRYYILATSQFADERGHVLKNGETFALFDRHGDLFPRGRGEHGLFHEGTRHLSECMLKLCGQRLLLLGSTVVDTNDILEVDLTNPDLETASGPLPHGAVHVHRSKLLWNDTCHELLTVTSHALAPTHLELSVELAADFIDIFEVRGTPRSRRGLRRDPAVQEGMLVLAYQGLDAVERSTEVTAHPAPDELTGTRASWRLKLMPRAQARIDLAIRCRRGSSQTTAVPSFPAALEGAETAVNDLVAQVCKVTSDNPLFDEWIRRSVADLFMLVTEGEDGAYPYAGVPWFSTTFGRDGIITALQWMWAYPQLAKGVLRRLARLQATEVNRAHDAEPGKILHEARLGEMAALNEIPFGRYYGTVDATPLFVVLAGAYERHTGDLELTREMWPAIEAALQWIENHGDIDGDGLVEYQRKEAAGLLNQGWKDAGDSVYHADGSHADGPIALCEVQGYVYLAYREAARLARRLQHPGRADLFDQQAENVRLRFEEAFWSEELGTYAHALDGGKRPLLVRVSNVGHCLWSGIARPDRARVTAELLSSERFFTGWGIRTVAEGEARYNPLSYHNGAVWPHDSSLVTAGLARYGHKGHASRITTGLFEATRFLDLTRLPELFCGFSRRPGRGPTLYPVACAPQAWATGVPFLLLSSLLGLKVDGSSSSLCFEAPMLPEFLGRLELRNLRVGERQVDLCIERHPGDVSVRVLRRDPGVQITMTR